MIGLQYRQWVLQNLNRDITEKVYTNIFLDVQEDNIDSCINQSKPSQPELGPRNVVNSNTRGLITKAHNVWGGHPHPHHLHFKSQALARSRNNTLKLFASSVANLALNLGGVEQLIQLSLNVISTVIHKSMLCQSVFIDIDINFNGKCFNGCKYLSHVDGHDNILCCG